MQFLILGICLLAGLILGGRWFMVADPKSVARVVRWGGIILGAGLLLLIATRIGFAGIIPFVIAGLLFRARRRGLFGGPSSAFGRPATLTPGQTSEVETAMLRMSLDHDSGEIAGSVRSGNFEGRDLHDLSFREALDLYAECQSVDEQSANLVESFLDRVHGADWRERADAEFGQTGSEGGGRSSMTADEAYEVLGLDAGASAEDVKEAHHRLMLKMHPDQGGSTYLASKINQAKDLLLGAL